MVCSLYTLVGVHLSVFEQNLSWLWLCMLVWALVVDDVTIWGCAIDFC